MTATAAETLKPQPQSKPQPQPASVKPVPRPHASRYSSGARRGRANRA